MAEPGPRIVSINELRFRPANSNDRARAGMEHAFRDVPDCSFGKDDGISPYLAADAGINDFPDNPSAQPALHDDVPDVAHDLGAPAVSFGQKLLRSGFALSIVLHVIVFCGVGYYATVKLPDDALLDGETVISLQILSDSEFDSQSAGEDEEVDAPIEKPVEDRVEEPAKVEETKVETTAIEKPVETPIEKPIEKPVEKIVEPAKLPEPVEEPVKPVATTQEPEVLATDQPSSFDVEQAARTILDTTEIQPLPETLPEELVAPPEVKEEPKLVQSLAHPVSKPRVIQKVAEVKPTETKVELKPVEKATEPKPIEEKAEVKLAQPLAHPVSKPKVVQKVAEVKPAETRIEPKPVEKKTEPKVTKKVTEKKPEKKKPVEKTKKVKGKQGADESDNDSGSKTPTNKGKRNQDASQGGQKNQEIGNASVSSYKGLLERKIARAKKRVRAPGKGEVLVGFTVSANGSVSNVRIKRSSGKPAVDKAAIEVVRKASPFPAIPAGLGKRLNFEQPIGFNGR